MQTTMDTLLRGWCRVIDFAIAACLATMVVLVFGNVVLRYAFNSGIAVSEELSRWLFVWLTFLGSIAALHDHAHLGTDFLVGRLGRNGKRACLVAAHALMLLLCAMLFRGAWAQTQINWDVAAPTTGFSMAWVYGAGLVFSVSAAAVLLNDLWRLLSGRTRDEDLVMIRETEERP